MKDTQVIQEALEALQSEAHDQQDKMEKQEQRENKLGAPPTIQQSSVHFFPETRGSDATILPLSRSLLHEMPLSYCRSTSKISELTTPTTGLLASTSVVSSSQTQKILDIRCLIVPKKQTLLSLDPEPPMIGEGEDYFLSLFGNSKKLTAHSNNTEKICKHFSMILEEVGQSTS
ncbi:PREDICTED: intermediate filament tail domain-containing protein 1-like, partial [Galeopterus variegatus]|uniref:Intermediate filament tail domain-containing protein 1-like n=1 Tax=Galeopterus variegatus TaxID=482537 RepID=A0ABM0RJD0_GALVR